MVFSVIAVESARPGTFGDSTFISRIMVHRTKGSDKFFGTSNSSMLSLQHVCASQILLLVYACQFEDIPTKLTCTMVQQYDRSSICALTL